MGVNANASGEIVIPPGGVDLSGTLGVSYWGLIVSTLLLGITFVQSFIYFTSHPGRDRTIFRAYVALLIILDIASSCFVWQLMFSFMVQHYGDTSVLAKLPLTWPAEFAITTIVACLSQMFYAHQIHRLKKTGSYRSTPAYAVAILSAISCVSNLISLLWIIKADLSVTAINMRGLEISQTIGNSFAAASDLLASATLCLFLATQFPGLEKRGQRLIVRLLFFTINRGALFSVIQIGRMVSFLVAPQTNFWIAFHFCLSKVHVNTLLAQLNARAALLEGPLEVSKVDFHISGLGGAGAGVMSHGDVRSPGVGGFHERSPRSGDLERGAIRFGGRSPPKAVAVSLERLDVERAQTGSLSKSTISSTSDSPYAIALPHIRRPSDGTDTCVKCNDVNQEELVLETSPDAEATLRLSPSRTTVPVLFDMNSAQSRRSSYPPRPRSADSYLRRR